MTTESDTLMEAECKYRILNIDAVRESLDRVGAERLAVEHHCDTYLRHPSRDFRTTDEALRIREIDDVPFVTYKGKRLEGPIKIRPEIELPLAQGTVSDWLKIWENLGFSVVASVRKTREVYRFGYESKPVTITLDHIQELGYFAEIERLVRSREEIEQAKLDIQLIAQQLGLDQVERRSYLGLLLAHRETN